ncbi:hypothetical protein [Pseudoneobacillus sp. C159]
MKDWLWILSGIFVLTILAWFLGTMFIPVILVVLFCAGIGFILYIAFLKLIQKIIGR